MLLIFFVGEVVLAADFGLDLPLPEVLANLLRCLFALFRFFIMIQPQMGGRHSLPRRRVQFISVNALLKLL